MTDNAVPVFPNTVSALDRVAIGLSGLCAIHCLATPVVVVLFPLLSTWLVSSHVFHELLFVLIVPSSILALTLGCRRHRDITMLGFGGVGLGLLVAALAESGVWERPLTLGATILIAAAHVRNYWLCRPSSCCELHDR